MYHCLLREGQGRGRIGTNSNVQLKSVKFSMVTMKNRSVQESKQTIPHIPITQHKNYVGRKRYYSLFLLAAKQYLHSAEA